MKIKTFIKPLQSMGWLFVLVATLLLLPIVNLIFIYAGQAQHYGVIGGPEATAPVFGNINEATVVNQAFPEGSFEGGPQEEFPDVSVVSNTTLLHTGAPIFNSIPSREGIVTYRVQEGDNLSSIAAKFGISLNTIYWNNSISSSVIQPGEELDILPVSGVAHAVEEGDTIESIATEYGVDVQDVVDYNKASGILRPGETLIVPNGKLKSTGRPTGSSAALPSFPNYFAMPTTGWNWGRLHNHNAIDIANSCGTPVYAAAQGLVVESLDSGWNYGYGQLIHIEHPNGTETKYAHLEDNFVEMGDIIQKGDKIGTIGNTGKTHGPTGCHLHFEVDGAKNPFAK